MVSLAVAAGLVVALLLLYAIAGAIWERGDNEGLERTTQRAGDRLETATGGLFTVGRVIAVTAFSLTVTLASEGAVFIADVLELLSQAPMTVGQIVIGVLGYIAALGQIRPVVFAALAAVTIVLAVGVSVSD